MKRKFKPVKEISIEDIKTRVGTFQGRQKEFSEATYKKILNEGFDKSREPIEVWFDPGLEEYVVISGHSRYAAAKELYKRGQEDLKTLPVKEFTGDLEEAIEYALESNFQGTREGIISEVKLFKRKTSPGTPACNKKCLEAIFKEKSRISKLQDLSNLNISGRFLEELNKPTSSSFGNLEQYARWVGRLRKEYPQISDKHETEIFDAIYSKKLFGDKIIKKDKFFDIIQRKVANLYFDPNKPLNLKNVITKSAYDINAENQISELDQRIKDYQDQKSRALGLLRKYRKEGNQKKAEDQTSRIKNIEDAILKLQLKKEDVLQVASKANKATLSLFDAPIQKAEEKPKNEAERLIEMDKDTVSKIKDNKLIWLDNRDSLLGSDINFLIQNIYQKEIDKTKGSKDSEAKNLNLRLAFVKSEINKEINNRLNDPDYFNRKSQFTKDFRDSATKHLNQEYKKISNVSPIKIHDNFVNMHLKTGAYLIGFTDPKLQKENRLLIGHSNLVLDFFLDTLEGLNVFLNDNEKELEDYLNRAAKIQAREKVQDNKVKIPFFIRAFNSIEYSPIKYTDQNTILRNSYAYVAYIGHIGDSKIDINDLAYLPKYTDNQDKQKRLFVVNTERYPGGVKNNPYKAEIETAKKGKLKIIKVKAEAKAKARARQIELLKLKRKKK